MRTLRKLIARHRLQKLVDANRESFAIKQFTKNRNAQINSTKRRAAPQRTLASSPQ